MLPSFHWNTPFPLQEIQSNTASRLSCPLKPHDFVQLFLPPSLPYLRSQGFEAFLLPEDCFNLCWLSGVFW